MRWIGRGMVGLVVALTVSASAELDRYGGDTRIVGSNSSGFFRVERIGNRWWLITPENHGFYSRAHTTTLYQDTWGGFCPPLNSYPNPYGNRAKYNESYSAWVDALRARMRQYGFNSLGAWGDGAVPETPECVRVLFIRDHAANTGCRMIGSFPDVWDPKFAAAASNRAQAYLAGNKNNPYTIGAFPDNEIPWQGAASWDCTRKALAEQFIDLPAQAHGKQAFVSLLQSRYAGVAALNAAWGTTYTDWLGVGTTVANMVSDDIPDNPAYPARFNDKVAFTSAIADRYYSVCTSAMRAADPNHLVFSARWALWTSAFDTGSTCARHAAFAEAIWEKAGQYCDIIAVNSYISAQWLQSTHTFFTRLINKARKPFMITEWASFADDTQYERNPYWLRHQRDRGAFYQDQVVYLAGLAIPDPVSGTPTRWCLGNQWFQFYDEPSLGRTDLERVNFGLFNVKDEAYITALDHMATVNIQLYDYIIASRPLVVPEPPTLRMPASTVTTSRPTFRWYKGPTAAKTTLLYSPELCFPQEQTYRIDNLTGEEYTPPDPLTAGIWYWCARSVEPDGTGGNYTAPLSFTVNPADLSTPVYDYMRMENLAAWRHVVLNDNGWDGTVYAYPDHERQTEGRTCARVVYTVNSLNKDTGRKNTQTSTIVFRYIGPILDLSGVSTFDFAVMPSRVVDASGTATVSTRYLSVRVRDQVGGIILNQPVDSAGALEPLVWHRLSLPLVAPRAQVHSIEFNVFTGAVAIPWDQRMTIWLDDLLRGADLGGMASLECR